MTSQTSQPLFLPLSDPVSRTELIVQRIREAILSGQPLKARPAVPARPPEAKRPEVKEKSKILDALGGLTASVPKVETGKA